MSVQPCGVFCAPKVPGPLGPNDRQFGPEVGKGPGVLVTVGVAEGVRDVGVSVAATVGRGVGVSVGTTGVSVEVGVGASVLVGVGVCVGVGVAVNVSVGVTVGVDVLVAVGVTVAVAVKVGVGVKMVQLPRMHAASKTGKHPAAHCPAIA